VQNAVSWGRQERRGEGEKKKTRARQIYNRKNLLNDNSKRAGKGEKCDLTPRSKIKKKKKNREDDKEEKEKKDGGGERNVSEVVRGCGG